MANRPLALLGADGAPQPPQVQEPYQFRFDANYELFGQSAGIDFRSIRLVLVRERWLILLVLLVGLALGAASIAMSDRIYRAETVIQVEHQLPNVLGNAALEPIRERTEADRFLNTQVDVLRSRGIAASVVEELNLPSDAAFRRETGVDQPPGTEAASHQAVQSLQERLGISTPTDSRIIRVTYDSSEPRLAANVANAITDNFIASSLQRRFDTFAYSRDYLEKQIGATKARLERSERALIAYARAAGLVDASGAAGSQVADEGRRSLTTANLIELNAAYAQARANRLQSQQRWQQAQATPLMSLPEVLSNPAIQELTRRKAEFESIYEEERQRRKEEHPGMQQAAAKIAELNRQIAALAGSIRTSIGDQYRVAQRQENAFVGTVSQLKSATLNEQEKGVRYNILKREVDTNRSLFNTLLERRNQISSEAGLTNSNISVVDRAIPPSQPVYPNPMLNMAIGGFGGLSLGLLFAFMRQRMNDTVNNPVDVERDFEIPLLGVVPKLKGPGSVQEALSKPRSALAEAHHSICMFLDSATRLPSQSVLLLTSSGQNEGKSTTAMKLGSNLAASGRSVVLIDGDMRRGSLHRQLGFSNGTGLSDILRKEARTTEAMQHCLSSGLSFISRGSLVVNPAELLSGPALSRLLDELRDRYDITIIDGPPVLGLADAPRLAAAANATLFVVEAHGASKECTKTALRRLCTAGANIIGIVLTKFDPNKSDKGFGYGYMYEYGSELEAEEDASGQQVVSSLRRALDMLAGIIKHPRMQPGA